MAQRPHYLWRYLASVAGVRGGKHRQPWRGLTPIVPLPKLAQIKLTAAEIQ